MTAGTATRFQIPEFTIGLAGESGLLLTFNDEPTPRLSHQILRIGGMLESEFTALITDLAPAYKTLAIFYDSNHPSAQQLHPYLTALAKHAKAAQIDVSDPPLWFVPASAAAPAAASSRHSEPGTNHIRLPVYYDPEVALDLIALAQRAQLSIAQLIALHTGRTYNAYANGFAPGFCYLGSVDPALAAPRHATPRASVAAGSVAIADRQTAVYPRQSPGGWHIIGRCPVSLFDANHQPPNAINVGDSVQFYAIERAQFLDLGGVL